MRMSPDDAFGAELMAHRHKLKYWARKITVSAADADDLVGETLLKAWRARADYRPGSELGAWLYTILTRLRYTQMRDEATHRRLYGRPVELEEAKGAFPASPPSQVDALVLRDLVASLPRLHPDIRAVAEASLFEGLDHAELVARFRVPLNTIKTRVHRARTQLRAAVEGLEAAPCP